MVSNYVLEIDDKVLRFGDRIVAIDNISEVSMSIPEPQFPSGSLYAILFGILAFALSGLLGGLAIVVALLLIAYGGVMIAQWKSACDSAPKGISIHLNSGTVIRLMFKEHKLADKLVQEITEAINSRHHEASITIQNAEITDSQIGTVGSWLKNAR